MNHNKKAFRDDIEKAERNILIAGWLGVISAIAVIGHSLLSI